MNLVNWSLEQAIYEENTHTDDTHLWRRFKLCLWDIFGLIFIRTSMASDEQNVNKYENIPTLNGDSGGDKSYGLARIQNPNRIHPTKTTPSDFFPAGLGLISPLVSPHLPNSPNLLKHTTKFLFNISLPQITLPGPDRSRVALENKMRSTSGKS